MEVLRSEIADWMKEGEYYRENEKDFDGDYVVLPKYVRSQNVQNLVQFIELYEFSKMMMLDYFPITLYIYGYYNKKEVIDYLNNRLDNEHLKYLREDPDLKFSLFNEFNVIKNNIVNYIVTHLSQNELETFKYNIENTEEKLTKGYDLPYRKDVYNTINKSYPNDESKIEMLLLFKDILQEYNKNEDVVMLRDIENNTTLILDIDFILNFFNENPSFYKSKEFIEGYNNTIFYNFKLNRIRDSGHDLYDDDDEDGGVLTHYELQFIMNNINVCFIDLQYDTFSVVEKIVKLAKQLSFNQSYGLQNPSILLQDTQLNLFFQLNIYNINKTSNSLIKILNNHKWNHITHKFNLPTFY